MNTQRRVAVEGTPVLARAARAAGVARLVHVSTAAVYDRSPGVGDVDENCPLVGDDADGYAVTKRDADAALAQVEGITRILLRPPAILGSGESSIWNSVRPGLIRDDEAARHAITQQSFPWVHVDDLAARTRVDRHRGRSLRMWLWPCADVCRSRARAGRGCVYRRERGSRHGHGPRLLCDRHRGARGPRPLGGSNVSSARIPQFDVFRRRGYDARIFSHGFRSVAEGVELYESIMARDPSAYVLQQQALYLSQHGRHVEAFSAIEDARNSWRGRKNWTIENTYCKVLFLANMDKVETHTEALDLCRRALKGLAQCFGGDFRQGQHALIYSDLALRFATVGGVSNDEARSFLDRSLEMLKMVRKGEPYLDRPRYLIREVEKRIQQLS